MPDTRPRPFALVIMPFAAGLEDAYQVAIKPACEAAGAYAERVDEQIFQEDIVQRVYNQIAKADLLIAELTDRNPNVLYETGYAHAIGKTVILLMRQADIILFDLQRYPHIVYGHSLTDLRRELEKHVRHFVENMGHDQVSVVNTIEVRVNRISIVDNPVVTVYRSLHRAIDLKIDVTNSAVHRLKTVTCRFGLLTPLKLHTASAARGLNMRSVRIAEYVLHYVEDTRELFPGAWASYDITAEGNRPSEGGEVTPGERLPVAVRVFTNAGYVDYPFIVSVIDPPDENPDA